MKLLRELWCVLGSPGLAILTVGCSISGTASDTVVVQGMVTHRGSPVEGATVLFELADSQSRGVRLFQAETGEDGRYSMSTHVGHGKYREGIVPGKYLVSVVKFGSPQGTSTTSPPKHELPEKYADTRTSGLAVTVPSDTGDYPIILQ